MVKGNISKFNIGLSYVGAFVGAGFISGQELAQFFIRFGAWGILGWVVVVAMIVFGGGRLIFVLSKLDLESFDQLVNIVFTKKIRIFVNLIINGYLVGGLMIMLSGAGSLLAKVSGLTMSFGVGLVAEYCWYGRENYEANEPKISPSTYEFLIPKLIADEMM